MRGKIAEEGEESEDVTFVVAAKDIKCCSDALEPLLTLIVGAAKKGLVHKVAISGNENDHTFGYSEIQLRSTILEELLSLVEVTIAFHKWNIGHELQHECTRAKATMEFQDCTLSGHGKHLFGCGHSGYWPP